RLPLRLRAAAPVHAAVAGDAVGVARAMVDAGAAGALIGAALLDAGHSAGAETVASPRGVHAVSAAGGRYAHRLGGVLGAAADSVAGARLPAGRLVGHGADLV